MRSEIVEVEGSTRVVNVYPVSPTVRIEKQDHYGQIADLEDEEPADLAELDRMVLWQVWGPVLALRPVRGSVWSEADGCLEPDWQSVGMVDCKGPVRQWVASACCLADLRAELGQVLRGIEECGAQLPAPAQYLVLKWLRMGVITMEHVVDERMRELVRLYLRARDLRRSLAQLDSS